MGARSRFKAGTFQAAAWLAAGVSTVVASGLTVAACITAPPPDLPQLPTRRPTVLHDAVRPPEGLLDNWPSDNQFTVPVEVGNPSDFFYRVFVDYPAIAGPQYSSPPESPPGGGIDLVQFTLDPLDPAFNLALTPAICPHHIELIVAHSFDPKGLHTPDSFGGDSVTWEYFPGGGPAQCPPYDAGGGSAPDASLDGLPLAPESGGDF